MEQAAHVIALDKAKILLMSRPDSVFFTTLCFSLRHVFSDEIPTACTDGRTIWYSPKYFMGIPVDARISLVLHETLHCAYMHMARLGERNMRKANCAADYVINLQLRDRGFRIPDTWLCEEKYRGMSFEEVYLLLPEDPTPPPMEDLVPSKDHADAADMQAEMQDILVRASLQSKMAGDKPGTIPGEIELFLNKLLNPKLPWNRILLKYMQSFSKNDYSFQRPNRRYFPDHYLPSMHSTALIDIAIAVDISGSVSDTDFLRFISETNAILKTMKPGKISLIQFDTTIKSIDVVHNINDLKNVTFTGRGGTAIAPVLEWANENKPKLLLVFTDGEFRFGYESTKIPTVWLIHNNQKFSPPFGKTIHYEM